MSKYCPTQLENLVDSVDNNAEPCMTPGPK